MNTKRLMALLLALLMSGCAGSAQLGAGLSGKEQLLEEVLSAPTAICTALQMQNIQAALQLKAMLTSPAVTLPTSTMTPIPPPPPVPTS